MDNSAKQIVNLRDEKAFESIFKEHYESLVYFAERYVDDPDIAEEMIQEMFSSLWKKADQITIRTTIKSYLFGAVRNACLNYLKHEKIKRAHVDHVKYFGHAHDEVDFLEFEELKNKIDEAFTELPPKCREIFELSRFEGKKYQEIADELNISIKTVENQMGKALKILREELRDYLIVLAWMLWHGGKF